MPNCKTIAICNQKGGTGKPTTTVNLGVGLARLGKKVLLVHADPQGDLTTCLGWRDNDSLTTTITDKLSGVIRCLLYTSPVSVALELVSSARCSEMDIVLDLWVSAVYNDTLKQRYRCQ